MIEMRLRQLYNTTSEQQEARQENDNYIRYLLLILLINTYYKNTLQQVATDCLSFFLLKELKKKATIQVIHSVPEVNACSSMGRVHILSLGALQILAGAGQFCVHGKRLRNVTDSK